MPGSSGLFEPLCVLENPVPVDLCAMRIVINKHEVKRLQLQCAQLRTGNRHYLSPEPARSEDCNFLHVDHIC